MFGNQKWECVCRPEWPNTEHDFNCVNLQKTTNRHASLYYYKFHTGDCNMSKHSSHGIIFNLTSRQAGTVLLEYKTPANTETHKKLYFYMTHHT